MTVQGPLEGQRISIPILGAVSVEGDKGLHQHRLIGACFGHWRRIGRGDSNRRRVTVFVSIVDNQLGHIDPRQVRHKSWIEERGIGESGRTFCGHGNNRPLKSERIAIDITRIAPIQEHRAANGDRLIRASVGRGLRILGIDDDGIGRTIYYAIMDEKLDFIGAWKINREAGGRRCWGR